MVAVLLILNVAYFAFGFVLMLRRLFEKKDSETFLTRLGDALYLLFYPFFIFPPRSREKPRKVRRPGELSDFDE